MIKGYLLGTFCVVRFVTKNYSKHVILCSKAHW